MALRVHAISQDRLPKVYTQILTGSSSKVIFVKATALDVTWAVMKRRVEQR